MATRESGHKSRTTLNLGKARTRACRLFHGEPRPKAKIWSRACTSGTSVTKVMTRKKREARGGQDAVQWQESVQNGEPASRSGHGVVQAGDGATGPRQGLPRNGRQGWNKEADRFLPHITSTCALHLGGRRDQQTAICKTEAPVSAAEHRNCLPYLF